MSVTQEIKSRLDIVDVVSDHVQLRKSGRSYAGFCPFHSNTRTPAFYVFPESQTWHCFGACAEGGDIFSFVMKKEGWDFREALVNLAARANVKLEPQGSADRRLQDADLKLIDLMGAAADYFHQLLRFAPQADHARRYVQERGLTEETQSVFLVGFALDSWDACRTHFNSQGYGDEELLSVGLLTENPEKGTRYDRFRNRLMIPIRDIDGRIVGFGARTLAEDGIPKYLNSPQTDLFDKSSLLFGLGSARPFIREARQVVIVEGYMDVMQAWQAGFRNVVAQMGTALTEQQLRLLKRYTKRFVLALDADAAGMNATLRGLQVARDTLDRDVEIRFDARGLVQHEGRLKADIQVVTLPPGSDPDKIIRQDPNNWPELLSQAKPVVEYVIEVATRDLDMNDAKGKAAVARQVLPLIGDIADPIERDHYRQQLARALKVDERALRQIRLPETRSHQPGLPTIPPDASPARSATGQDAGRHDAPGAFETAVSPLGASGFRQANFLRQCLHYPRTLVQVNQRLALHKQPIVTEADFPLVEDKFLLRHMYQRVNDGAVVTIEELCDSLDEVLSGRVQSLLAMPLTPESEVDRLADSLVPSVLDWRLETIRKLNSEVRLLFDEASHSGDGDALELYRQQLQEWHVAVRSINKARDAMSATGRRRAEDAALGRR